MAGTIRKLTLPVLLALGLCVVPATSSLPPNSWMPASYTATAAPAKKTGVAALRQAQKLLKRGKPKQAAGLLNGAISSGSLAGVNMAQALYYRGLALRKMGKPAQAVADFTNALWLKNGLNADLRAAAEGARAAAYREAGLQGSGGRATSGRAASGAAAPKPTVATVRRPTQRPVARTRARSAPATGNWQTQTRGRVALPAAQPVPSAPAVKPKSDSNGISGFFSNLFGGGKKKTAAANQPVPARVQALPQGATGNERITQVSAWSSRTKVQPPGRAAVPARPAVRRPQTRARQNARPQIAQQRTGGVRRGSVRQVAGVRQPARRRVASNRRPPQPGRSSVGAVRVVPKRQVSFGLILSPVRSLKVANANAVTVRQRFAQVLGQRKPIVEQMSFGDSTFFQVRIGPFANAAPPKSVCAKLIAAGIDCVLARH